MINLARTGTLLLALLIGSCAQLAPEPTPPGDGHLTTVAAPATPIPPLVEQAP
ncbi:MAG: hypothetical protein IT494_00185 [Gammaproteobacteria bacterium]|nr:hypothetical protein [Gammaproteobacteria bacterium]